MTAIDARPEQIERFLREHAEMGRVAALAAVEAAIELRQLPHAEALPLADALRAGPQAALPQPVATQALELLSRPDRALRERLASVAVVWPPDLKLRTVPADAMAALQAAHCLAATTAQRLAVVRDLSDPNFTAWLLGPASGSAADDTPRLAWDWLVQSTLDTAERLVQSDAERGAVAEARQRFVPVAATDYMAVAPASADRVPTIELVTSPTPHPKDGAEAARRESASPSVDEAERSESILRWIGIGLLVLGIVVEVLLRTFAGYAAPEIWKAPEDVLCQEAGYWYATTYGSDFRIASKNPGSYSVLCERWSLVGW